MSNHYHFLIQAGATPLSKLMASVLGGFAGSYNRRHGRCGYVFQNRYKSILVDRDSYLIEVIRYIHLNPVAVAIVESVDKLNAYPWTGHAGLLNKHKQHWHSVDAALAHFGQNREKARSAYLSFLSEEVSNTQITNFVSANFVRSHSEWESAGRSRKEHSACIGDERILGSSEFIQEAIRQDSLAIKRTQTLTQAGWDIEALASWVCSYTGISHDTLMTKARRGKLSEAKSLFCYLGASELGLTLREIADYLSISQPSVSAWVRKGRLFCRAKGISLELIGR